MTETKSTGELKFRGGPVVSGLPLAVFIFITVALVVRGNPAVEAMIVAAMVGISLGMTVSRNMALYSERVFDLMANRIATVAIVCWLWAGAFSGILADSGLVEAIVCLGWKFGFTGSLYTASLFVFAALFATSVGTGIAATIIIGPLAEIFLLSRLFYFAADGSVAGSAVQGALSLLPVSMLTLLLVTMIGLLQAGGFLAIIMEWIDRTIARTTRGAELAIIALISVANLCVSVNTVAMVATGPLANVLRKRHKISAYRSANLLDTTSCSFPYILPYSATVVTALAIQRTLAAKYSFVVVTGWLEMSSMFFYGLILFPLMVIAVLTGFGRKKG